MRDDHVLLNKLHIGVSSIRHPPPTQHPPPLWGTALFGGSKTPSLPSTSWGWRWGWAGWRDPPSYHHHHQHHQLLSSRGLCMLLFPLHAQTPSPPRCARRGLGRLGASQAAPGSPPPWCSAGGTGSQAGSGPGLGENKEHINQHKNLKPWRAPNAGMLTMSSW